MQQPDYDLNKIKFATDCKHMVVLALYVVMYETVEVLKQYARLKPECILTFRQLQNRETSFGWEKTLLELSSGQN